jgi:hypothetical protein
MTFEEDRLDLLRHEEEIPRTSPSTTRCEAERALDVLVPQWIAADWPFRQPRYLGRDIAWQDWLALPPAP